MASNTNHADTEPLSPDAQAYINSYTPSKEPQEEQDFFGRRALRIMNGQDPKKHPEKFTPQVSQALKWPTNDEAYAWAEPGRRKRALFNTQLREAEQTKKLKTPSAAAASSSTPITYEAAAAASSSYTGPALPIQL